jgi:hypothetical protein
VYETKEIVYMGKKIRLQKVDTNSISRLKPKYSGVQNPYNDSIIFQGNNFLSFENILHEITELHLSTTGVYEITEFNKEVLCTINGKVIEQLILENGVDIIKELWEFSGVLRKVK